MERASPGNLISSVRRWGGRLKRKINVAEVMSILMAEQRAVSRLDWQGVGIQALVMISVHYE